MNRFADELSRFLSTVKLSSRSSYIVQRSDGMGWMGPNYFQGYTFTDFEPRICRFKDKHSASAAVKASGLDKWLESNKNDRIALHVNGGAITVENDGTVTFAKVPND